MKVAFLGNDRESVNECDKALGDQLHGWRTATVEDSTLRSRPQPRRHRGTRGLESRRGSHNALPTPERLSTVLPA
jgi:hypothetical protein